LGNSLKSTGEQYARFTLKGSNFYENAVKIKNMSFFLKSNV
jgi:hypothetical protein